MPTTNTIMLSTLTLLKFVVTVAPLIWAAVLDDRYDAIRRLT
jgi:hypothetical protein